MYKTITDPYTEIAYPVNSIKGIHVLKNYINFNTSNMAGGGDTAHDAHISTLKRNVRHAIRNRDRHETSLTEQPISPDLKKKLVAAETKLSNAKAGDDDVVATAPAANSPVQSPAAATATTINATPVQVLEEPRWVCECNETNCTCNETSGKVEPACIDYATRTATAMASEAKLKLQTKLDRSTIIRLERKVSDLMNKVDKLIAQHGDDELKIATEHARAEQSATEATAANAKTKAAQERAARDHADAEASHAEANLARQEAITAQAAADAAHKKEVEEHSIMTIAKEEAVAAKKEAAAAVAAAEISGNAAAKSAAEAAYKTKELKLAQDEAALEAKLLDIERAKTVSAQAAATTAAADAKKAHHETELAKADAAKEHASNTALQAEMEALKGPMGHFKPLISTFSQLLLNKISINTEGYVFGLNMPLAAHEREDDIYYITLAKTETPDASHIVGSHNHAYENEREYFAFEVFHNEEGSEITSFKIVYYYDGSYHDFMQHKAGEWVLTPNLTIYPKHKQRVTALFRETIEQLE